MNSDPTDPSAQAGNDNPTPDSRLVAALKYAALGIAVIVLHGICEGRCTCPNPECQQNSWGKHPRTRRGLKDATTDTETIGRWWKKWPNSNIGLLTGTRSGIWALDVDPRHDGHKTLAELELSHGPLPPTYTVDTGGGGLHLYFRHLPGLGSTSGRLAGLDTRGDGGYVVAAPGDHWTGGNYRSRGELQSVDDLASPPSWLVAPFGSRPAPVLREARGGEDEEILTEGGRNAGLASLAGKLRRSGLSAEALDAALQAENGRRCKPPLHPSEVSKIAASIANYDVGSEKPPSWQQVVSIGDRYNYFRDELGAPCVEATIDGRSRVLGTDTPMFRSLLAHEHYKLTRRPLGADTDRAIELLTSRALFDGDQREVHVRAACHDGAIFIDLHDETGRAVRVEPGKWSIVEKPPVMFRRFPHLANLPEPMSGGDLHELFNFINAKPGEQGLLLLCRTVVALVPNITQPILILWGMQGTAKTYGACLLRDLVDPSPVPALVLVNDVKEVGNQISQNYQPVYDNLGAISPEMSNLFCMAATGGAIMKRQLYTDTGVVVMKVKRPLTLTAINLPSNAPDLLERSIFIELEPISPERRKGETQLTADFAGARARLFGALLDTLARAMEIRPSLKMSGLFRMADFTTWGAAAAVALGYSVSDFETALTNNAKTQNSESLRDSVADGVIRLTEEVESWTGTYNMLLTQLLAELPDAGKRDRRFPQNPTQLSRHLRTLEPALLATGIEITRLKGHGEGRRLTIARIGAETATVRDARMSAPGLPARERDDDVLAGQPAHASADSAEASHASWRPAEQLVEDAEDAEDATPTLFSKGERQAGRRPAVVTSPVQELDPEPSADEIVAAVTHATRGHGRRRRPSSVSPLSDQEVQDASSALNGTTVAPQFGPWRGQR